MVDELDMVYEPLNLQFAVRLLMLATPLSRVALPMPDVVAKLLMSMLTSTVAVSISISL